MDVEALLVELLPLGVVVRVLVHHLAPLVSVVSLGVLELRP